MNRSLSWPRRTLVCAVVAALQFAAMEQAVAAISQQPLLSRARIGVKPNLMLTLDTSGSMAWNYMPETAFTVVGAQNYTVQLQNLCVLPGDAVGYCSANASTVTTTNAAPIASIQFRTGTLNGVYYNPETLYLPWLKADGTRFAPGNPAQAYWDPTNVGAGWTTLTTTGLSNGNLTSNAFYYRLNKANGLYLNPATAANYTLVDINRWAGDIAKPSAQRTDCVTVAGKCTKAEELQNYANWFVYYRSRMTLAKGALSESFAPLRNDMRLGWTTISNSRTSVDGIALPGIEQGVRDYDAVHRANFIAWIQALDPSGSTPLRTALWRVGQYFNSANNRGPWADNPAVGDAASSHATCRRSYNILTTDGYYNDAWAGAGNVDGADGALHGQVGAVTAASGNPLSKPDTRFQAISPYKDGWSNTLSDIATYYWARDLRPDLENRIDANTADPAYWQHLTQYTVGMGVDGTLNPKTQLGSPWPDPSKSDAAKIDDLWHAAVNTRGQYFSAKDPVSLAAGLKSALAAIAGNERMEAGVSTAGPQLIDGNRKYVPQYRPNAWVGDVQAYSLNALGAVVSATPVWRASERLPVPAARKIYTTRESDNVSTVAFEWANLTSTQRNALVSTDLLAFLRGDRSKEGDGQPYRKRDGVIGDIVSSNPLTLGVGTDLGYSAFSVGGTSYAAYLTKRQTRPTLVAVGANDGMLHVFQDTKSGSATDGAEVYAFVPKGVVGNLKELADPNYGTTTLPHRAYVDGALAQSDAYITTATSGGSPAWTNVLSGSLGAGGKGVFLVDASHFDARTLGANSLILDLTGTSDADMGHVLAPVQVGRLVDGSWKAIFGNGYDSTNKSAALYIVDLATKDVQKLVVPTTGTNGLGGVSLLFSASGNVTGAYAGDLQGNMWRFDFVNASGVVPPAPYATIAFGGTPLAKVKDASGMAQPITAAPALYPYKSTNTLVVFGTGKLYEDTDVAVTQTQSVYGLMDTTLPGVAASTAPSGLYNTTAAYDLRSTWLVAQTVSSVPGSLVADRTYYAVSSNPVDYATRRGWYMDLTLDPGQRVVNPIVSMGAFAYISSVRPGAATNACGDSPGKGYNFFLPALTGGQFSMPVFDTNGDGVVNFSNTDSIANDANYAGFSSAADGIDTILKGDKRRVSDGSVVGGGDGTGSSGGGGSGSGGDGGAGGPGPAGPLDCTASDGSMTYTNTSVQSALSGISGQFYGCEDPNKPPGSFRARTWRLITNPPR